MNVLKMLTSWFHFIEGKWNGSAGTCDPETTSSLSGDYSTSSATGYQDLKRILDLRHLSRTHWNVLPNELREPCLQHLRACIPPEMILTWKVFGFPRHFHFSEGMAVRNLLRDVLRDEQLPPVEYPDGPMRNWDDYYMGALDELLEGCEYE
jgi:hypothetical protein